MIATLFGAFFALIVIFYPPLSPFLLESEAWTAIFLTVGTLFTFLLAYSTATSTRILQKAEKRMIPRVIKLFEKDSRINARKLGFAGFALLSFVLATGFWKATPFPAQWLLGFWIVVLGFAIDGIRTFHDRVLCYADPLSALDLLEHHAYKAAEAGEDEEMSSWLDSLSTLALKATERADATLAERSVRQMFGVLRHLVDKRLENRVDHDRLSFAFVYAAQRWEMIFRRAAVHGLEDICLTSLHQLGKTAALGSKVSEDLAMLPLIFLGKLTRQGRQMGLEEISPQSRSLLIEVARAVLEETGRSGKGFQEPLLSIIHQLEDIGMTQFEADKGLDLEILKHPFRQIVSMLKEEAVAQHEDAPVVLQELERVVGDLANLELVLRQRMEEEVVAMAEDMAEKDED